MFTKTLRYLHFKLSLKSILLAFSATIFFTACGIKGPLYQTPPQPNSSIANKEDQRNESEVLNEEKNTRSETTQSTDQEIEPQ